VDFQPAVAITRRVSPPQPDRPFAVNFASLPLSKTLIQVVAELGWKELTPIQGQAIPLLLEGKDLIGQSSTGSGKTAAFTLPMLQGLDLTQRRPQALVLCPTRELCTQVAREIRKLGRRESGLSVLILSGGQPINPQLSALAQGVHVVVGTPGRVLDHLARDTLDLTHVGTVVVDEADRMLDMGFGEDMGKVLGAAPEPRQTVFFSATFPRSIEAMSGAHQRNPVRLTIGESDDAALQIRHVAYETDDSRRLETLLRFLESDPPESAIIFCNLKATVRQLEQTLSDAGVSTSSLHGDLEQKERDFVMAKFRNHSTRVLIATDVAARGLDIDNLDVVVNFELPFQAEIYVHRVGRTGRAGKAGLAVSFVGPGDKSKVKAIEACLGTRLARQNLAPTKRSQESAEDEVRGDPHAHAAMETLYISGGRKDKMRPGDILGALTGEAGGLRGADIGKIEIHDRFSYVAVAKNSAHAAVQQLSAGRIKGKRFKVGLAR
jgi:ATP-dependent RNA helicase DbpA